MAKKKALCRASRGLYVRNLGWKRTPDGYAQHKFYLGRDEAKATFASLRLEQLRDQVNRRWERENKTELWFHLVERVRKDHSGFRRLSLNKTPQDRR